MRGALDGGLPLSEVAATSLGADRTHYIAFDGKSVLWRGCRDADCTGYRRKLGGLFHNEFWFIPGGLGLLATCGVGVVSAPAIAGTAVLMGAIDLTLNWQKRSSEKGRSDAERAKVDADRARADDKKIEAETIGQELENEIKRLRLGNLPAQAEAHRAGEARYASSVILCAFCAD